MSRIMKLLKIQEWQTKEWVLSVDEEREASQHRAFRGAEVRGMCWFLIGKEGMSMDMGTTILLGLH